MTEKETQANKELLLKDLSARLPYGVIGQCEIDASYDTAFETIPQTHKFDAMLYGLLEEGVLFVSPMIEDQNLQEFANEEVADGIDILDFKPYLFPIWSMTDEQKDEYSNLNCYELVCFPRTEYALDYLIKNYFDYRYLIDNGLAIDATGLNIY